MFVAYLTNTESHEHGIGFIERGDTEKEATAKLKTAFIEADPEENQQEWEAIIEGNSEYSLHICEVE